MKIAVRGVILFIGLICLWQLTIWLFHLSSYIVPSPKQVLQAYCHNIKLLMLQTWPTLLETVIGLVLGSFIGAIGALAMAVARPLRFWMMPILVISQALPTFAIAPLLVIWFGYGMASKIAVVMLMLFFPVTSAFYDGLSRTESAWLDMAKVMGANTWRTLWFIRVPAALPALASGLRVATVFAPMGAIIGEWVGASYGLGFLMLNANARMQIDLVFSCLFNIILFSLLLYFMVDKLLKLAIPWQANKYL